MAKTLDQQRAAFAWECACTSMKTSFSKEYKALAKGAPALIMSSGLMPTLAFYNGKRQDAHCALLDQVTRWLASRVWSQQLAPGQGLKTFSPFMEGLAGADSQTYMRATDESLEILKWIRQFVDAV
ncbi:type III-B CRISPR module-associated protein Cmr5 [uncultured Thiodictyon sp.]|uniref:type III-B CRISPR module-associated protein Cmr5 n=1 Tax=uncultured Thiodictyon sp. TaxID=1846217 RepID=UPI0025DCCBFF|nr:type III-B CRISPR module-associated protein Cmr5 [uncultured Thiodictyon sp.]